MYEISMLLEHLVVGFEPAPPTTAVLCTTGRQVVQQPEPFSCSDTFSSSDGYFSLWTRSLPCVGHTAVFCGHQGKLRLRGASVPFWLVVVWRRGAVSGLSVAGRL